MDRLRKLMDSDMSEKQEKYQLGLSKLVLGALSSTPLTDDRDSPTDRVRLLMARLKEQTLCERVILVPLPSHANRLPRLSTGGREPLTTLDDTAAELVPGERSVRRFAPSRLTTSRREGTSPAWTLNESSPAGLCIATHSAVRTDNTLNDYRFLRGVSFSAESISQLCVPVFAERKTEQRGDDDSESLPRQSTGGTVGSDGASAQDAPEDVEEGSRTRVQAAVRLPTLNRLGTPKLVKPGILQSRAAVSWRQDGNAGEMIGVLKCLNKKAVADSRAGFSFTSADEDLATLFAELIVGKIVGGGEAEKAASLIQAAWQKWCAFHDVDELRL